MGKYAKEVEKYERQPAKDLGQAVVQYERLGDRIEGALDSLGITQERWIAAKGTIGLPSECNCDAKIEWLNKLDETLQLGEKLDAFKAFMGWKK